MPWGTYKSRHRVSMGTRQSDTPKRMGPALSGGGSCRPSLSWDGFCADSAHEGREWTTRGELVPRLGLHGDKALVDGALRSTGGHTGRMAYAPPVRHLLRAKDLADARYAEPLGVDDLARRAGLSRAHFSREFRRAFGEPPHTYLLTRRLERAAALLRTTDRSVPEICFAVGLRSVGSFTTSFTRTFGRSPTAYRAAFPPASERANVPTCVLRVYGGPNPARFEKTAPAAS